MVALLRAVVVEGDQDFGVMIDVIFPSGNVPRLVKWVVLFLLVEAWVLGCGGGVLCREGPGR